MAFSLDNLVSSGLPVVGGVINSLVGNDTNKKLLKMQQKFAAEQATLAFDRQRQLIQESPQLEKLGLISAGLNPASLSPSYSSSVSTASTPSTPGYVGFNFDSLQQLASNQAAIDNMNASANKANADAELARVQASRYNDLTDAQIQNLSSSSKLSDNQVQEIVAKIPLLNNQASYYWWLSDQADVAAQKMEATYQSDIDYIKQENKTNEEVAKERFKLAKSIVKSQLELTFAQSYNLRASGQAQLSNAYTNRLQYELDSSIGEYVKRYYNESAGLQHEKAVSENSLRDSQMNLLDSDAAYKRALGSYTGALELNIPTDNLIRGVGAIGSAAGSVMSGVSSLKNANTNWNKFNVNPLGDKHVYHHRSK